VDFPGSYTKICSDVNKDLTCKAKAKVKEFNFKAKAKAKKFNFKAKDLIYKAKPRT